MGTAVTLAELNAMDLATFVARLRPVTEEQEWVLRSVWEQRPFADLQALHEAFCRALARASVAEQEALIAAHSELAGEAVVRGAVTALSAREQAGAGLTALPADRLAEFRQLTRHYRERFGFPFVICVRDYSREEIVGQLRGRLQRDREQERAEALRQITRIWWHRLHDLLAESERVGRSALVAPREADQE